MIADVGYTIDNTTKQGLYLKLIRESRKIRT